MLTSVSSALFTALSADNYAIVLHVDHLAVFYLLEPVL